LATNKNEANQNITLADFIKDVSAQELRKFIITKAKYNLELQNAVFLEFSKNIDNANSGKYSVIIRKALESVPITDEYYHEDLINITVMDQWLEKAKEYFNQKQYSEAVLICKACIEEYSKWLYYIDDNVSSVFYSEYCSLPFSIIKDSLKHLDKKDLFEYYILEMRKKKYSKTAFIFEFKNLIKKLKTSVNTETYIVEQDELLKKAKDKSSSEAEIILRKKYFITGALIKKKKHGLL